LTYPDTRVEMDERGGYRISVLRAAFVPKVGETEWPRTDVYGGKLFNNAVQGTAASLLREATRLATYRGLAVVMHVHDELVVETLVGHADRNAEILHDIMNTPPKWAAGLPLKADVERMERFGK
jgi:DNA polymerase